MHANVQVQTHWSRWAPASPGATGLPRVEVISGVRSKSYHLTQSDVGMHVGCTVDCGCDPPDDEQWMPCHQKVHLDGAYSCHSGWFGLGFYDSHGTPPTKQGAYQGTRRHIGARFLLKNLDFQEILISSSRILIS